MYIIATMILSQEHFWIKQDKTLTLNLEKASPMTFSEANEELFNMGRMSAKGTINPNCHYEIKKLRPRTTLFTDYVY